MVYDNSAVRRQDRLLGEEAAAKLLNRGEYGVLSLSAGPEGGAYGIPLNYVWDGCSSIYIHCATEGRKLRLIEADNAVSFCVVGRTNVLPSKFTTEYESLILNCTARTGLGDDERQKALELFVDKYSPGDKTVGQAYIRGSFSRTEIIRLDISDYSGKTKRMGGD